jgi:hypothetical protein
VDYDHATIVNAFEEEVNALVTVPFEKQPIKERIFQKVEYLSFVFL